MAAPVAVTPAAAPADTYGALVIGLVANPEESTTSAPEGTLSGLLYGGDATQLVTQIVAALFALVVSFTVTLLIGLLIKYRVGFRVRAALERESIDLAEHGKAAYEDAQKPAGRSRLAFGGDGAGASVPVTPMRGDEGEE